jgi:hypothetical protein
VPTIIFKETACKLHLRFPVGFAAGRPLKLNDRRSAIGRLQPANCGPSTSSV